MPDAPLEVVVGELLMQRSLHLAVAESCTGGLIGHRLTNVPGSSLYFLGGVIAYAYEVKVSLLGVRWETLETYGAVSRETVMEMAHGVRRAISTDIGLAVSGVAGPGGGTPDKPVGLVWIGLSTADQESAWQFIASGDRLANKEQFAERALEHLLQVLQSLPAGS